MAFMFGAIRSISPFNFVIAASNSAAASGELSYYQRKINVAQNKWVGSSIYLAFIIVKTLKVDLDPVVGYLLDLLNPILVLVNIHGNLFAKILRKG
jgi:hypothetical protein